MSQYSLIFVYFLLTALAVGVGGIVPVLRRWSPSRFPLFLSLSAGLLLGTSFFHLIPHAIELTHEKTGSYVLLGLVSIYLFEKFITVHICEEDHCEVHKIGVSAFVGLFLHSLTDGFALGASVLTANLGGVVFIAIFVHKVMEAFSLSSILMHLQKRPSRILLANAALLFAIPLGAFAAFAFLGIGNPNQGATGIALAFSAGTFLHVALSDLLPEVHRHSRLKNQAIVFFVSGLLVMMVLTRFMEDH